MSLPNNPTPKEMLIMESLIAECRDIGERIVTLLNSLERVIYRGSAVLALAVSVVLATDMAYLLTFLPAALSVVILYGEFVNNDIKSMGAYKKALEEKIKAQLDSPVILWESTVVRLGRFNWIYQAAFAVMFALALIASIVIALLQAFATTKPEHWLHAYSIWIIVGTILSIILGVACVVVGFRAHERNMHKMYEYVCAALGIPVQP